MNEVIKTDTPPVEPPKETPPAETPPAPEPSPEPKPNEETPPAETPPAVEPPKEDVNYADELNTLKSNEIPAVPKPGVRTEEEKAKFTIEQIYKRFPDLKEQPATEHVVDDRMDEMQNLMLRNQVEGIIRGNSKTEDETKYKMYFYDKRIQQTGNIHDDADNAEWLANKNRTRNAISEMKSKPDDPTAPNGPGQKTPSGTAPDLPEEEHQRLISMGLKKVSQGKYEGEKVVIEWDVRAQQWNQTIKQS